VCLNTFGWVISVERSLCFARGRGFGPPFFTNGGGGEAKGTLFVENLRRMVGASTTGSGLSENTKPQSQVGPERPGRRRGCTF